MFSSNLTNVIQRVTYPVLSEIQDDKERMIAAYLNNPTLCYISHVSVLGGCKRNDLFCRMLVLLEKAAKQDYCSFIKFEVKENNAPAISAYKKNGFEFEVLHLVTVCI